MNIFEWFLDLFSKKVDLEKPIPAKKEVEQPVTPVVEKKPEVVKVVEEIAPKKEEEPINKSSDILIDAIKRFEGFSATAYKCPAGVWTIGYGHTEGVKQGDKITKAYATDLLKEELGKYESYVAKLNVAKTQGQFDALVDFCYNLGNARLGSSTLLKKIRAGAGKSEIATEFMRWNKAGGKVMSGLTKRRQWEVDRYFAD